MGAALLTQPDKVKQVPYLLESYSICVTVISWPNGFQILTSLVQGLKIPVTCKIRILPTVRGWKIVNILLFMMERILTYPLADITNCGACQNDWEHRCRCSGSARQNQRGTVSGCQPQWFHQSRGWVSDNSSHCQVGWILNAPFLMKILSSSNALLSPNQKPVF